MRRARPIRASVAVGIAGIALVVPVLASAGGDEMRTVAVTIRYSSFAPQEIHVTAGETVRFIVRNGDPIDHEFLIGDEDAQTMHEEGTEAHHGAKPGEVSVPAGGIVTTTYRFGEPGSTLFGCHLPGHYAYGMRGTIRIG